MNKIKQCKECGKYFPATEEYFYKTPTNSDGLVNKCKECKKKYQKKHYDPKYFKKRYRRLCEQYKSRYKKNRSLNVERYKITKKIWRENHKEKLIEYTRNHKNHTITKTEWEDCKNYFNNQCAYCGKTWEQNYKESNKDLHKEHVINDGKNTLDNCVPACYSCNSSKRKYSLNNWYNHENLNYTNDRYHKICKWIRFDCKKYKIKC